MISKVFGKRISNTNEDYRTNFNCGLCPWAKVEPLDGAKAVAAAEKKM